MKRDRRKKIEKEKGKRSLFSRRGLFPIVSALVLCTSALLVYSNTFRSPFQFDDFSSIVWNGPIQNISNLRAIWSYSPTRFVTYTSFALNYHLHLLDVEGYHVFNLLIHIGAGLSAWWLLLLIFRTPALREASYADDSRVLAFFGALIFLIHPLQTQAVTYIVQRAASLATAFYLLSMALYLKGRLLQLEGKTRAPVLLYIGTLVAGSLAMFSKEIAYTLPAMIVMFEFFFFKERSKSGTILLAGITTFFLLVFGLALWLDLIPIPEVSNISRAEYILTQLRVLTTYLRLFILPVGQNVDYDFLISRNVFEHGTALSLVLLLALVIAAVILFRRQRAISFSVCWFFLTLLPESSIIPIPDVIYEHRMYLPMFGCSLFLVTVVYQLLARKSKFFRISILTVLASVYAIAAFERNKVWRDEVTMTTDVIAKSPRKARAYSSRGLVYMNRGDYASALFDFHQAIARDSLFIDAYLNRGTTYAMRGERGRALQDFNKALQLDSLELRVLTNRANLYIEMAQYDKAIQDLNRSIGLKPDNSIAYVNRGLVYYRTGDSQRAIVDYDQALTLNPGLTQAYLNRLLAYLKTGRRDLALRDAAKIQELGYKLSPDILALLR